MPVIIEFNFKIVDGKDKNSSISLYALDDPPHTINQLNAAANAALPVIRNVLKGGVIGCSISFQADLADLFDSFPTLRIPDPDSDIEEGGLTKWATDETFKRPTKMRFPTFDEDLLVSGTRDIDDSDPRFEALITLITEDLVVSDTHFSTSRGENFLFYVDGEEKFKRRKYKRKAR